MKETEELDFICLQRKVGELAENSDSIVLHCKSVNEVIEYIQKNLPFTDEIRCYYIVDYIHCPYSRYLIDGNGIEAYMVKITEDEVIYPLEIEPKDDELFFAKSGNCVYMAFLGYDIENVVSESWDYMDLGETWIIEDYDGNIRAEITMGDDEDEDEVIFYDLQGDETNE